MTSLSLIHYKNSNKSIILTCPFAFTMAKELAHYNKEKILLKNHV